MVAKRQTKARPVNADALEEREDGRLGRILAAVALYGATLLLGYIAFATPQPGTAMGAIRDVLCGLGGSFALVLPALTAWLATLLAMSAAGRKISIWKSCFDGVLFLLLLTAAQMFTAETVVRNRMTISGFANFVDKSYSYGRGGGALGAILAWPLYTTLGTWGGFFTTILLALICLTATGRTVRFVRWLNDRTANWAGSTAYPDFPASVSQRNRVSPLKSRIDTMQWTPSAASAQTNHLPDHLMRYPFRHTFGRKDGKGLDAFAQSPLANREITRVASEIVTTQQLGAHDGVTDMLNVAYTLLPYDYTKTSENRYELIDSYIKLDAQLADLFRTVDRSAGGSDNVLIYLAGTPPRTQRRREDERWKIPSGEFSTRKAISLLNLYLIAVHGNGEWVTAYADGSFYLNENLAKERNISKTDLRREAASLLKRMARPPWTTPRPCAATLSPAPPAMSWCKLSPDGNSLTISTIPPMPPAAPSDSTPPPSPRHTCTFPERSPQW